MSSFDGPLRVEYVDGETWIVEQGFTYHCEFDGVTYAIQIPRGFITDFASMPLGVVFRSPGGKWDKPAVVHDLLYRRGYLMTANLYRVLSRDEADAVFKGAMEVAGVPWWQRQTIWLGVRVGGWRPWNRYREEDGHARA